MKIRIGLCAIISVLLLWPQPTSSFVPPEEITLMTVPRAALYWFVAHEFNTLDAQYGKYVATELVHTNGTAATTIGLDVKHLFNAVWREVMAGTLLPEANNYLKQGNNPEELDKVLAVSTAQPATIAGLAYDLGRAFLTIKDFYLSAMQTVQKWYEYEVRKMVPAPCVTAQDTQGAHAQEPASLLSPNTWKQVMSAIALDPEVFMLGLTYFFTGFFVNKGCQLTGPAFRAIVTKNNNYLFAINTDPATRYVDTFMAFPMTVFMQPYAMSALSDVRSEIRALAGRFIAVEPADPEAESIYASAYVSGDKGLFGYYGIKATVALVSMVAGALWVKYHPLHAHAH